MIIDCESCEVRGIACGDCVIGVLLGTPSVPQARSGAENDAAGRVSLRVDTPSGASTVQFDATERRALDLLAAQGLIPRLRLVVADPRRVPESSDSAHGSRDAV